MSYKARIDKNEVSAMPTIAFDGRIITIDTAAAVDQAMIALSHETHVGIDTETRPSFKAGVTNRVALLQLSTHERCYLIRLCRTKLHNSLLKILSNPNIIKIGADVAGDIRSLHALRHFQERGFIDLQQIASNWGIEEKSLRKMSAIVLGERVSKAQRLSNWEASTLTPQQQMYAATDAWVCIAIYEKLMSLPPITPLPKDLGMTPEPAKPKPQAKERKPKAARRPHYYTHRKTKRENREKQQ